ELRRKYVWRSRNRSDVSVRIVAELRRRITFRELNFMDEKYPIKDIFDVVFLRNVMIYFDSPPEEAVINKICRNLAPGGYLFVGHSESLAGFTTPLTCVGTAVFRNRGLDDRA